MKEWLTEIKRTTESLQALDGATFKHDRGSYSATLTLSVNVQCLTEDDQCKTREMLNAAVRHVIEEQKRNLQQRLFLLGQQGAGE